ncbi:MAG: tyrosine recombinase XerC, partial [Stutzerimonas stutzeri]
MQNELDAYFEYLRSARQLSGHSLDAYRRDLDKVLTYCERERIAGWRDLQGRHLRHLIAEQ